MRIIGGSREEGFNPILIIYFVLRFPQSKSSPAKGKEEEFGSGLITVSVVTRRLLSSASLTPAADDKHKSQGRSSFGGEVVPKQDSLLVYKVTVSVSSVWRSRGDDVIDISAVIDTGVNWL